MSIYSSIRALFTKVPPASAVVASSKDATSPSSGNAASPPAPVGPLADPYEDDKSQLRTLSKGLMATGGAIATILVAGSQVTNIGGLDTSSQVTVLGLRESRLVFAVIGLGVALGSIALAVAAVAWVQTTSFVTLDDVCDFPTEKKRLQFPGSRIKFRVRESIERDLARRGTGALQGAQVPSAAAAWKAARDKERERREALVKLNESVLLLASPNRVALEEARSSSDGRGNDLWADGNELISLATKVAGSTREPDAASDDHSNLDELQDEAVLAYTSSIDETKNRFELVQRILQDASYLRLKYSFSMVLKYVVLVLALAGAGISTFAWATHPPKSDQGTPGVLVVTQAQASSRGLKFIDCDASTLKIDSLSQPNELIISAASSTSGKTCVIALSR